MQKPSKVRRQSVRTMFDNSTPPPTVQDPPVPAEKVISPASAPPEQTEQPALAQEPTKSPELPQVKRSKLGYAIRDDLIKKCKQLALDEDKFVYEVVEELLEEGLSRKQKKERNQEI